MGGEFGADGMMIRDNRGRLVSWSATVITLSSESATVVIEPNGDFVFTNHRWHALGLVNSWFADGDWKGSNYLKACDVAAAGGADDISFVQGTPTSDWRYTAHVKPLDD